jgi:DNA polymerase III alpha subunit (gram-positive type)
LHRESFGRRFGESPAYVCAGAVNVAAETGAFGFSRIWKNRLKRGVEDNPIQRSAQNDAADMARPAGFGNPVGFVL